MNQILLQPTDVLFFRDGRPMGGSLAGHGDAWPLPHVINNALHAALHRSGIEDSHAHRQMLQSDRSITNQRVRRFGSLVSAGPFPVREEALKMRRWFFPRPADAHLGMSVKVTLLPAAANNSSIGSNSLPWPMLYTVGSCQLPCKEQPEQWISTAAFEAYLKNPETKLDRSHFANDSEIRSTEHHIGIGIDPNTGSQDGKSFYSAHYLRMREEWSLGVVASGFDKATDADLIAKLIEGNKRILVGGQQRICTAARSALDGSPPLPRGLTRDFPLSANGKYLLKWVLLSPSIWPAIADTSKDGRAMNAHPGGWLPNWISEQDGHVLLRSVSGEERKRRRAQRAGGNGYAGDENSGKIQARLVAAIVPKPLVITGWSLGQSFEDDDETADQKTGAKSAHFAVPGGAVYYFEADTQEAAEALAAALNWHGSDAKAATIRNRRSTLMGEKGFGLGVCGAWTFFPGNGDPTSKR